MANLEAEAITPELMVLFDVNENRLCIVGPNGQISLEATELNSVVNFARRCWPIKDVCPMCLRWSREYIEQRTKKGAGEFPGSS